MIPVDSVEDLEKGQLAYRDMDGNLIILPMQDQSIREAFIARITQEFIEDREPEELLDQFKQSLEDAVEGRTSDIDQLRESEGDIGG